MPQFLTSLNLVVEQCQGSNKKPKPEDYKRLGGMAKTSELKWLVFAHEDPKFPYRLYIEEEPNRFLSLKTQDRWPGPGKRIFCKKEGYFSKKDLPQEQPLEESGIVSCSRYGRKLTVILDRKIRKRCWFIFLRKGYKSRPEEFYEQIFWITQAAASIRRPGAYIPQGGKSDSFQVIMDRRERYSYKFGQCKVIKENLPCGDYGLLRDGELIAVAERKTMDNLFHEIATYDVLKATLQEMSVFRYKAVVFESPYGDFINPKKSHFYKSSYVADILADLIFSFPDIQFIFCENRKLANEWIYRWFRRINLEVGKKE